jgi:FKBP-type peptidyl-prolyl cis-trans isomerase (trigger factor)
MSQHKLRIEVMEEILGELNILVTKEQLEKIVQGFSSHIEMEKEMSMYQHTSRKQECLKCQELTTYIKLLESNEKLYIDCVKTKTKASAVWIERGVINISNRR